MMSSRTDKGPPWWRSSRYLLAVLAALGYACFFLQRVNLSMAIVCMVNHTFVDILTARESYSAFDVAMDADVSRMQNRSFSQTSIVGQTLPTMLNRTLQDGESKEGSDYCATLRLNETDKEDGELVWSKETQGLLLSSLFWGYFVLNLPAQRILQKTGCKNMALWSVFILSVLSMLSPLAAVTHVWALMSIRIAQGLVTALGVAAVYAMWGTWAPAQERATLMAIVFTGNMVANAVVFPTSALLCRHGFAGGWPSVFYVFGIVGIVWCVLWAVLVFETPERHPRIDPKERKYIMSHSSVSNMKVTGPIPWLKICSCMPVWAVVASQIAYNYPFYMFMAGLPQYMKEVLKFDIQSNGLYIMLPYISLYVFTNLWSFACKIILRKKLLSINHTRKLSALVGDVIPGALYVVISFLDCNQAQLSVFLMALALGISGTNLQGFLINPYDIAPRYATAIFSISNTISVGTGIIAPYVVAALTVNKTREQWQLAFLSSVGISMFFLLVYLIFGTATEMDWARGMQLEKEIDVVANEQMLGLNNDSEDNDSQTKDEKPRAQGECETTMN